MSSHRSRLTPDVGAGLLLAAFGAYFCGSALLSLKIGTAFRMGPGYFPAVVGGLLLLLGLVIAVNGLRSPSSEAWGPVPWKALILIPAGLVLFGFAMRPLGLLPALLALCFLAAVASGGMSLVRAAVVSLAMTAITIGIFSFGLGIHLPLLGDWLR